MDSRISVFNELLIRNCAASDDFHLLSESSLFHINDLILISSSANERYSGDGSTGDLGERRLASERDDRAVPEMLEDED